MGNCLVTKLNSVVNNDNLDYLDGIKITVKPVENYVDSCFLRFVNATKAFEVFCPDGGNHLSTSSDLSNATSSIIVPAAQMSNFNIYVDKTTEYSIVLRCKYSSVSTVYFYGKVINVDVSDFKHMTGLRGFTCYDATAHGDINQFTKISALQSFTVRGNSAQATGNLSTFNSAKNLLTLFVGSGRFTGEIKDLADAQVAGGSPRTSGSLAITSNGVLTLNGVLVPYNTTKTITFDSSLPGGYSIA